MTAGSGSARADSWARLGLWPGIRTFRSRRFRTWVGVTLWAVGATALLWLFVRQAGDPSGQFGVDFAVYRSASLRMLEGASPYPPELLQAPIAAQGVQQFLYPPFFAQVIAPLAALPFDAGAALWLAIQAIAIFGASWIAASAAGARASRERFVWTGVALTYFYPVFDTLWKGNVSGILALSMGLLVAVGREVEPASRGPRPIVAGLFAGIAGLIKLTPLAVLPALVRARGQLAAATLIGLVVTGLASIALAPQAWLEYARVLPNQLAGDARHATNLAPAIVLSRLGADGGVVELVRAATIVAAVLLLATSVWLARDRTALPAAVGSAGLAALLVPSVLWYHYVVAFIPIAAFGWFRAGWLGRVVLLACALLVNAGLAFLPIAALGILLFAAASVALSWPTTARGRAP